MILLSNSTSNKGKTGMILGSKNGKPFFSSRSVLMITNTFRRLIFMKANVGIVIWKQRTSDESKVMVAMSRRCLVETHH